MSLTDQPPPQPKTSKALQDLVLAMKAKGFKPIEAMELIIAFSKEEYSTGYTEAATRIVQHLNDRWRRDFEILKASGLVRDNSEIVIPIQELIETIKKECHL